MAAATACFMPRRLLLIFCVTGLLFRRGQGTSSTPEEQHLFCGDDKYEVGSPYAANVGWLLPNLTGEVIRDGTIYQWKNASKWGSDADVVGSTAMCYADHSPEDCAQCLRYVAGRFHSGVDCPNAQIASAFYDACLLWYYKIFPILSFGCDAKYTSMAGRDLTGTEVAASFRRAWDRLLDNLSSQAILSEVYAAANSTKYGYGGGAETIYGLVQCDMTRTKSQCTACLNNLTLSVSADPTMAYMTIGKLKGYWCYIRYGTAQFDDHISEYMTASSPNASATAPGTATAPVPAMAPTTPSRSHQGPSRRVMVVAIIGSCSIVFLAGIILLLGCLFRARPFRTLATQPRRKIIRLGSFSPKQFSVNQLRTATENFTHPLGSGAFGTVYKGTMGGTEVAVKKLSNKDGVGEMAFDREACILMAFKHKNLVKLLGYCNKGEHRLLCFEYLSGGSLDKLIYDREQGSALDWSGRYKILQGVCSGLHYLHHELDNEQNIVHMDLKASNVLVSRGEGGDITNVKIADFGLSRFFTAETQLYTQQVIGLRAYMAPEYLSKGKISPMADIYSFGVLMLEIITGRCAMGDDDSSGDLFITWVHEEWSKGDVRTLMFKDAADLPGDCIAQARNCIKIALDCIQQDPNDRPDAGKIKQRLS
ncbi:hypothetical protein ACQ4PT_015213 [Festuca glaucescens]